MEIQAEAKGNVVILHIKGEFYIANIASFEETWQKEVDKNPPVIAIDCSELVYIDSSAIGTLVKSLNNALSKKIKLVFYDLSPAIQNIFKTARLDHFFTITTKAKLEAEYIN